MSKAKYKIAYAKINNAGDLFNEAIMGYFNKEFVKTDIINADLVMLGGQLSTLPLSNDLKMKTMQRIRCLTCNTKEPLHVWGTGFLTNAVKGKYVRKNLEIHALRGKLTKEKLREDLGFDREVVLADPGLLAAEFVKGKVEKRHSMGFIPHFRELDLPIVKTITDTHPELYFIDITQPYEKVLEDILSCETILSSSLHGLIFADSLKVPNMHVLLSDKIKGDGFKFRDYYSSFDLSDEPYAIEGKEIPGEAEIFDKYRIDGREVDSKIEGLIACFPKDL